MVDKITFHGAPEEQELASWVFNLMMLQGTMFSEGAAIRQSLTNLASYFVQSGVESDAQKMADRLDRVLGQNAEVFKRVEQGGQVIFSTSKRGYYVHPVFQVQQPEYAYDGDLTDQAFLDFEASMVMPEIPRPGVQLPSAFARSEEEEPVPDAVIEKAAPAPTSELLPARVPAVDLTLEREEVRRRYGDILRTLLVSKLKSDTRFAHFGDEWYLDELLVRFSKGDMRRLREYIADSGQAETDTTLLAEVLDKHPYEEDYERYLFSLNYRLAEDPKTFEFKGVADEYLWAVSETPSHISTRRVLKLQDIGMEYRYLERGTAEVVNVEAWTHTLSYFEWENGVLPYNQQARAILPPPFLEGQRAAVLEFRLPQWGRIMWAELRYPVGARGGWVDGLEDVWQELLVPGAQLSIERTDRGNVFLISVEHTEPELVSVLRYDERHGRFGFAEVEVNYHLDEGLTISETRFASLDGARRLDDAGRRQADAVLGFAFEYVGIPVDKGGRDAYWAGLEDLMPVVNIEKPFSQDYLVSYLDTQSSYSRDDVAEGYYLYFPG
ncbi:MAG: hypothetical protein KKA73_16865 [Chloroflexi bacterium]|nr:hypothetical protein [Chloroflexota bacterium]MBU1749359.1 hypothetical protein [Chloroflexota bacterium]MBU1877440.1 hypothetical protein [Chloroflexota bacterium]